MSADPKSQPREREEVVLLQRAIRCNTVNPPGGELALARILEQRLAEAGIRSDLRIYDEDRANLVACIDSGVPGPEIMLSGHLDTVPLGESPWSFDPFGATIHDGRIYGRGSADMKGGLIALLYAFLRQARRPQGSWRGRVWFLATFAEETGSEGARLLVAERRLPRFDALIIAEPTDNRVVVAHKGVLWVQVDSFGRTGHASMPASGVNAIDHMQLYCEKLRSLTLTAAPNRYLSPPTLSVTTINGGRKTNVIPDHCSITVDIRTLPGQDHGEILDRMRQIAGAVTAEAPAASISVSPILDLGAVQGDIDAPLVGFAAAAAARFQAGDGLRGADYFTDASAFQALGDNIVILGPGSPRQAHQTDEYLDVEAYLASIEIYTEILEKMTLEQGEKGGMQQRESSINP